jgi:type IV pilus assembly protein PilQ
MKSSLPFFVLSCLLALHPGILLHAQETDDAEVDRILESLEASATDPAEEIPVDTVAESDPAAPETEPVEEPTAEVEEVLDESLPELDDPSAIPAVSLEEAKNVEGLDIQGAENINEGLVTISYTDVSLADMVRIFAQTAGANIIIPEGLDQPVSGNLNDVYWRDALEVILQQRGFALIERQSGIFTITPEAALVEEPLTSETIEFQFITAEAAKPAVESLLTHSNATAIALRDSNNLIVKESAKKLEEIRRIVKILDRPRKQVFIEAKFVELNDSAIQDLGINWQVLQGYTVSATGLTTQYERIETRNTQDAQAFSNSRISSDTNTRTTTNDLLLPPSPNTDATTRSVLNTTGTLDTLVQGRNFSAIDPEQGTITTIPNMEQTVTKQAVLSAEDFALTLSALQQLDGTRIVSNPKMLVANGQTATIHVGRNEPNVVAVPQGENASTFAYVLDGFIEIGVKLEVTPTISTDKNITINITPELSRLLGEKSVGEAGTTFPITQIRRISTEFAVGSGMTVAIGGLTQSEDQEEVRKVPVLGDLPIIGKYLFTHTSTREIQDEIIIFVTVNSVNDTTTMNDRDGIPNEGKLIHTWLNLREEESSE